MPSTLCPLCLSVGIYVLQKKNRPNVSYQLYDDGGFDETLGTTIEIQKLYN